MGQRKVGLLRPTVAFVLLIVIWLVVGVVAPRAQESSTGPSEEQRTESVSSTGRYTEIRGFVDWFQRGGNFMYPLLISSIVGIAVIIEGRTNRPYFEKVADALPPGVEIQAASADRYREVLQDALRDIGLAPPGGAREGSRPDER